VLRLFGRLAVLLIVHPAVFALVASLGLAEPVMAQQATETSSTVAMSSSDAAAMSAAASTPCQLPQLQTDSKLGFEQRFCFYGAKYLTRQFALRGALVASFGQMRNSPNVSHQDIDDISRRFAIFYARHAAESAGKLLVGYLNHEDPRPHLSTEHGFWKRTQAAMLSVVEIQDADGSARPALAPVAGALASGLVGTACYQTHNSLGDGFLRAGLVYGSYFGASWAREFKPELTMFANRFLRKKKQD
jgi:hypothetical protein